MTEAARQRPSHQPYLVADVTIATTEEGGPWQALASGHLLPAILVDPPARLEASTIGAPPLMYDCGVFFEGTPVEPGQSVRADLFPIAPEYWLGLQPGHVVGLYVPPRRVMTATIVEPLKP